MALILCNECGHEVSDQASSCPKCGNPIAVGTGASAPDQEVQQPAPRRGGWVKWVFITPAVLFGMVMCIGGISDPDGSRAQAQADRDRKQCIEAVMSGIGHSTTGYADKAAYDAVVRSKCDGLEIDGKPLGR